MSLGEREPASLSKVLGSDLSVGENKERKKTPQMVYTSIFLGDGNVNILGKSAPQVSHR